MKSVQGVVSMLGYTLVRRKAVTYSVIEIGDQNLTDIAVPKPLIRYLIRASRSPEASVLYVKGKRLIGVQVGGDKSYYYRPSLLLLAFATLVSIMLIPVFGLGLYLLWHCIKYWGYRNAGSTLSAQGAVLTN